MIKRKLHNIIASRLKKFPAVALLGPRQSGKTTLAKSISNVYFDLEIEQEKLRLDLQWDDIVLSNKPVILDEAQNDPRSSQRDSGSLVPLPRLRSRVRQECQPEPVLACRPTRRTAYSPPAGQSNLLRHPLKDDRWLTTRLFR